MDYINYKYLRPIKANHLKEWYNEPYRLRDDLKTFSYQNAVILPLKRFESDNLLFGRGGVVSDNGKYIEASAINRRVQNSYDFTDEKFIDKKVVYCGYLINHWGHFLIEAISRLWYFLENDKSIDKYVFFINKDETREIQGNYKEFFELLGIGEKIEIINTPTRYREVIVPELGYKWRDYFSQNYKNIFETIAQNINVNPDWQKYEKIFFTRSRLPKAHDMEFGIEAIDSFFVNNGYELISPERISLSQLIYLIRNANVCASVSGSLPHNLLFAKDGQKLTIIERVTMNNEIQVDVNRIKKLDVTYIDANVALYPVDMSGPFIAVYDGSLKKYAEDNSLMPPDKSYTEKKYIVKCFKKYIKSYRKNYGYQWFMFDWYIKYVDYIYEAYEDGMKLFGEYIRREKPIFFYQYFQWHYLKQRIKKILKI